jgi:hypothetical protein
MLLSELASNADPISAAQVAGIIGVYHHAQSQILNVNIIKIRSTNIPALRSLRDTFIISASSKPYDCLLTKTYNVHNRKSSVVYKTHI